MSLKAADDLLEEANLDSLAEFAAGAGHEINNPLAIISGQAQLLLDKTEHPEARRRLKVIIAQVQRAYEMIADVRLFARPPLPDFEPVFLRDFWKNEQTEWDTVCSDLQIVLEMSGISIIPFDFSFRTDALQLHFLLTSLIKNAVESLKLKRLEISADVSVRLCSNSGWLDSNSVNFGLDNSSSNVVDLNSANPISANSKSANFSSDNLSSNSVDGDSFCLNSSELQLSDQKTFIPRIIVNCSVLDENGAVLSQDFSRKKTLRWTIDDNGGGIPEAIRPLIFSPFFSGRQAGRGLGFGLSKCWKIASQLNGELSVEPSSLGGTRFVLVLPYEQA